jgi:catechol 2,3-dioxygenase-like lactoylglutathione lyase family enzyme
MKICRSFPLIISIIIMSCTCESSRNPESKMTPSPQDTLHLEKMNTRLESMYPVIVTTELQATKQFYISWLNYHFVFESTWFVLLGSPGKNPSLIAFMSEDHPSAPPSPKAIKGEGMFLTLQVSDASQLYAALKASGAEFTYELTDEPWGQRRFALTDPNGVWIDVVEQIQPEEGWWDQYMVK